MATIDLTRASIEALEREARNSLDNSVSEAPHGHRIGQEDYAGEHERNLLTCADILGTLRYATLNFPSEAGKVSVKFSAPQIKWLEKTREASRGHVEDLDAGEGDADYNMTEVFLLHVLDRALGEREAVAV